MSNLFMYMIKKSVIFAKNRFSYNRMTCKVQAIIGLDPKGVASS